MNTEPLTTLKGIGEKTEKLFAKIGIYNLQQLLHYYPRDYDCYAEPVPLRECRQEEKNAVYGRIVHSPSVKGNQRKSVVVLELYEEPVRLQLTWFNMPFLRSTLKKGSVFIFRGKIQEKSGRLVMEQPEIFTPAAYHELLASLQPVYGLTAGLTNKMVSKAVAQVLERCAPAQDYLPEKIRARYELCEINYALHEVHFPKDQEHLATARQHYESLCTLLKENNLTEYNPRLLTGSTKAKERREIYASLEDGSCKMVIGTHALIQEKVQYKNLALVITDEQHRFGVRQRTALAEKGEPPNVLVMSATPIPRTLAIILYGDLSISVIDELPAKRLPIKNCVVDTSYRPKAYRFITRQVELGRQAYVICPMVEESEGLEAENVTDYTQLLKKELPGITVEMLHGQMKAAQKNEIMERFASGEIQVLVSTTVVEVGVNVPNATVMMVENAERFGLAQLHQLRGRVGRGEHQSYCIFIRGNKDQETAKRLEILNHSNDGFYIASEDLKLRGSGDLLGTRQSGDMEFQMADIFRDADILQKASEAASELLADDPYFEKPEHELLKKVMKSYLDLENHDIGL